jgi:hypothetical protein
MSSTLTRNVAVPTQATPKRILIVDQNHPKASDKNSGTPQEPFKTINAAAQVAEPGDVVRVKAGIYRERVSPARSGAADAPIVYEAAAGETVCIRGSEVFKGAWSPLPGVSGVYSAPLAALPKGSAAYHGVCDESLYASFNPYLLHFNRDRAARPHAAAVAAVQEMIGAAMEKRQKLDPIDIAFADATKRLRMHEATLAELTDPDPLQRRYLTTLGQVFVNGDPLREVDRRRDLHRIAGTWLVDEEGQQILLHLPVGLSSPADCQIELSVRHTVFAPLQRGLGHITVRGFVIEHAANHSPSWGGRGWGQSGALSCRSGHHWLIENNIVRYAKSLGIDCGSEGGQERLENAASAGIVEHHNALRENRRVGHHVIRNNDISDNGHCGIAGIGHYGTQLLYNRIERNNRDGWTSPWWEFAGIKFHFFFDGLIEGNLVRDNEAHGIWIDNQWRGSRITRNVIINNLWSGINVELGRGPVTIDHNIIALTRQGDGIYGHDVSDVTIAHNLIYANSNFGVWFAYATPRVQPQDGCWDIKTFNNLILGNRAGAIAYPTPWDCAGNNTSDGNLLMGGGAYLDEGSGPQSPLFQIANATHCGSMQKVLGKDLQAQTPDVVWASFRQRVLAAGMPESALPEETFFKQNYLVSLELWRAATGNDKNSQVLSMIRDGLGSRSLVWSATLDDSIKAVKCRKLDGLATDYFGEALPDSPLPGPFQSLAPGRVWLPLWPAPQR